MKKCKYCDLLVKTDRATCPLCLNPLSEDDGVQEERGYPKRQSRPLDKKSLFYRAVVFFCLGSTAVSVLVNLLTRGEDGPFWFPFVAFGAFYAFMLFRTVVLKRSYVFRKLAVQLISASVLLWGVNHFATPQIDWAMGYAIPMLAFAMNLVLLILSLTARHLYREGFGAFFLSQLIGVVPFLLWMLGVDCFRAIPSFWAPLTSACLSLLVLLEAFTISGRTTKEEFKKRFHF